MSKTEWNFYCYCYFFLLLKLITLDSRTIKLMRNSPYKMVWTRCMHAHLYFIYSSFQLCCTQLNQLKKNTYLNHYVENSDKNTFNEKKNWAELKIAVHNKNSSQLVNHLDGEFFHHFRYNLIGTNNYENIQSAITSHLFLIIFTTKEAFSGHYRIFICISTQYYLYFIPIFFA